MKNTTNSSPGLCHYTDWRLPNVNELASLINYGFNDGALCNNSPCDNLADWLISSGFENVKTNNYWTSTTSASGSDNAWLVNMSDGLLTAGSKSDENYVWAVRSILNDFTLTITKSGTGTGTVTSEPSGINCGSTCSKSFKENKNVTLTASAGDGSTFAGWSGSGCSGTGSCTVTMNSEKSVTATFNQHSTPPPPPPTCTYSISPQSQDFTYQGGSGTVRVTKNEIYCEQDNWTANTSESWISIISGSSGSGNGTVGYTVSENKTNSSRIGTITIAGNTFKVKQERATGKIISVNPTSINFGSLREGTKVTRQVTITNIGTETFYISGISITGTDVSKFAESNQCITLTAGSSCVVKVDYYANKRGDRAKHTGTLLIKSNATNNPTVNVDLTGEIDDRIIPQISLLPTQIDEVLDIEFGNNKVFTVTNTGTGVLIIEKIVIQGSNKGEFSAINNCSNGVQSGQSCSVLITTNYSSAGSKEAVISIISNAINTPKLEIPIKIRSSGQCNIEINKTDVTYSSSANTDTIIVNVDNQDCWWRPNSSETWITVNSQWKRGNGQVEFLVSANNSGRVRMGKIQIGSRIFTVIQANTTSSAGQVLSNFSIFTDTSGSSFENYINALYAKGLTTGCSTNPLMYCPSNTVTRETGAVFMIRGVEGNPASNYCEGISPFTDVTSSAWSCGHIKRLVERAMTYGCNSPAPGQMGTKFCPTDQMTRWQMAVMIIRALFGENFSYPTTPYFSDVNVNDAGFKYVQKFKEVGITKASGMFYPNRILRRDEMSAFLCRAFLGME